MLILVFRVLKKNIMKKLLLILAISLLFSCNKDDDNNTVNVLVGNWSFTEERTKDLNQPWSDWSPNYSNIKGFNFTSNTEVKYIYSNNTEEVGSYTFDATTNILNTNFPTLEFPNNELNLISIDSNEMILQKGDVHGNTIYQFKFVKATN